MSNLVRQNLIDIPRDIRSTSLFVRPTKISLLNFIGAADYFITDFGCIWHRAKVKPNSYGYLTYGYVPMVVKDPYYPYPWVLLKTTAGLLWLPVNQLLGWAFDPPKEDKCFYFLAIENPGLLPMHLSQFAYTTEPPGDQPDSRYLSFMRALYT